MRKFAKIASVIIAASMVTSSLAVTAVNAAADSVKLPISQDSALQNNVQDGVILHAFNWSYNSIKDNLASIAAAGYTTVQTSPVQQAKDYCTSNDVAGQWWKLYQPVSMAIAKDSWLGTKDELKALCTEAEKYGIKIICDIVSNHMGNETEENPNLVSSQVKTYQPDFYENKEEYFRSNNITASDSSVKNVVQGHLSACPDLNTGNVNVQNAVKNLLRECIDCGVDGFRFDAAKHIETPDDGAYASDYWKNISEDASAYYTKKTGQDLYIYGEILNNCGAGRKYDSYTKYINVTDNRTGDAVLYNVTANKASSAASSTYKSGVKASDVVLWAESHDTFKGDSGSGGLSNTADVADSDIVKAWAIVASRQDSTALYFARPGDALMGDASTNTTYKSTAVSEINKFHNKFNGQSEKLGSNDGVAFVVRGTSGIVLSNCNGNEKSVNISGTGLADGTYTDTVSGNKFTVANGVLTGSIGATGVAVVYDGTTTPRNTNTVESSTFKGETLTLTLGLENATSGTYSLEGGAPVSYTGTTTIRVGSDYNYGDTITLTLTATDGKKETSSVYKYVKKESASSGVYVYFNAAKKPQWVAPFYVYLYDENTSANETYSNAAWPGQKMEYDAASGYYYIEVSDTSCIAKNTGNNEESISSFDLAHSANTRVIFSDSNLQQYPGTNGKKLQGSSKIFALSGSTSWEDTTLVPTPDVLDATDVTKNPSVDLMYYGDVTGDGKVKIDDVTLIQRYAAEVAQIAPKQLPMGDVDGDGTVKVKDATCIQRFISGAEGSGKTGETYQPVVPTTKPSTTPSTKPSTAPSTAPTTAPAEYTLYFKTVLGWMTTDGVSLFAYDTASGTSYFLEKDDDAYPNVYTAQVPNSVSDVIVYRNLDEIEETPVGGTGGNVYNAWAATVSTTNNCVTLSDAEAISVGPYVEEEKPDFELSRLYFDNSKAKWSEVYVYGWGESGLGNDTAAMTNIAGTNIWYYDFDEPLLPGAKCFLFKNTAGGSSWVKQTNDITIVEGMNCYVAASANKGNGTWVAYTE